MSANVHGQHERFLELAAAAIDFELPRPEADELSRHLDDCRGCRKAAEAMRLDARAIEALPRLHVSAQTDRIFMARMLRRRSSTTFAALGVAVLALALGTAVVGSELVKRVSTPIASPTPSACTTVAVSQDPSDRPTGWYSGASLHEPRAGHTATVLADGRVLVCGGHA